MGLLDWIGNKIEESMNPEIESQFRYLYNNYRDGLTYYMKGGTKQKWFGRGLYPQYEVSLSIPFYIKRDIVLNKQMVIDIAKTERAYREFLPFYNNYLYGVCYVYKKYEKRELTIEPADLNKLIHNIINRLLNGYSTDLTQPIPWNTTTYRKLSFDDISGFYCEAVNDHKEEVKTIDKKLRDIIYKKQTDDKFRKDILGDEIRSKYYKEFLKEKSKNETDAAYCVENLKELDDYIKKELRKQLEELIKEYKYAVTVFVKLEDLDTTKNKDLCRIIKSQGAIAKLREKSNEELRDMIQKKKDHDWYVNLVKIQDEKAAIERERIKERDNIITALRRSVLSWQQTSFGSIPFFSMFYYYPTSTGYEGKETWENRKLIWAFKNDPTKISPTDHKSALIDVMVFTEKIINHFFEKRYHHLLTLVCIPASTSRKNELRFKEFSQKICSSLGMSNAFDFITVQKDRTEKHLGGDDFMYLSFDRDYFKDRIIILFDDIVTSGKSMAYMKEKLESYGATVICGISIGITKHTLQSGYQPIFTID